MEGVRYVTFGPVERRERFHLICLIKVYDTTNKKKNEVF